LLYHLAVEVMRLPDVESITRSELQAAVAELRFVEGYLGMVRRSAEESSLEADEEALARFAGRMARKVGDLAARIEERL
jgi:hypothetical protein